MDGLTAIFLTISRFKNLWPKEYLQSFQQLRFDYPNSDVLGLIKETYFCGEEGPEKQKVKKLIENPI